MSGKRPVVPEGFESSQTALAVRDEGQRPSGMGTGQRLFSGVVWCLGGSVLLSMMPVLACTLIAFGAAQVIGTGSLRGQVLVLVAAIAAACADAFLLGGVYDIPMSVCSIVCAFAMAALLMTGRLSTGKVLVAVAAIQAAMIGIDTVSTSLQGTSITALITDVVDQVVKGYMGSVDLDGMATLLETRDQLVAYWPTIYFLVAAGIVLCSLAGAWLGTRASGLPTKAGMISRYDVPLWVAVLFAVGVVVQLLGPYLPVGQEQAAMVGANVVMCTRIALAQQGLSVLLWLLRARGVHAPARVLALLVALWVELSLALVSVVGLLDVILNFRRLERGRPDLVRRSARKG